MFVLMKSIITVNSIEYLPMKYIVNIRACDRQPCCLKGELTVSGVGLLLQKDFVQTFPKIPSYWHLYPASAMKDQRFAPGRIKQRLIKVVAGFGLMCLAGHEKPG